VTPSRVRTVSLLIPALVAALALLSWTQPWVEAVLEDGSSVTAAGDVAAVGVPALALAGLALIAALVLAGPVFRVILGLLQTALGSAILVSAILALADPVAAAQPAITALTGVDGDESVRELVASVATTVWAVTCLVSGILGVLGGLIIAALARRWPDRTRRYEAARWESADNAAEPDRFGDWDALSDGSDPTAR
jgi:uncharacterized membrane protein (TIGR02234 family)